MHERLKKDCIIRNGLWSKDSVKSCSVLWVLLRLTAQFTSKLSCLFLLSVINFRHFYAKMKGRPCVTELSWNTDKSEMECQIFVTAFELKMWFNNNVPKGIIIIMIIKKKTYFRDGSIVPASPADIIYGFYGCPRKLSGTLYFLFVHQQ